MSTTDGSGEPLYCICKTPYDPNRFYIGCDNCDNWFHGECVNITQEVGDTIETYYCSDCQVKCGPIRYVKQSSRDRTVNYSALNNGLEGIQGAKEDKYSKWIADRTSRNMFAPDPFQRYKGNEISLEYFKTHGLTDPIVFPSKEGLDMSMPEELTVWDVAREVGEDVVVDAIYVPNQSEQKFSLKEWANYYSDPYRKKIYNIISLEISGSKLGKRIRRPRLVR